MAKKSSTTKLSDAEQVDAFMQQIRHGRKKEMELVRKIIKGASPKIQERIKWNAPSYYYIEDIVTFGPVKDDRLLLVFHHPHIDKIKSSILEGEYKGRRLAYFTSKKEIETHVRELERVIIELITAIDKKVK